MKQAVFCAALLLTAACAHAQFIDPEIIRRAGEAAATGNIQLGNVQIDNVQVGGGVQQRMPTAAEIAAEMRAQQQSEQQARAYAQHQARRQRVDAAVERAYNAEYRAKPATR